MSPGGLQSNIGQEQRWRIGEDRDLWIPVYEEAIDGTRSLPVSANTWTTTWVLRYQRDENEEYPVLVKPGVWDHDDALANNGNGLGLSWFHVPIDRVDTVPVSGPSARPGRYYYTFARTNSGAFRVLCEGYAEMLHAATR